MGSLTPVHSSTLLELPASPDMNHSLSLSLHPSVLFSLPPSLAPSLSSPTINFLPLIEPVYLRSCGTWPVFSFRPGAEKTAQHINHCLPLSLTGPGKFPISSSKSRAESTDNHVTLIVFKLHLLVVHMLCMYFCVRCMKWCTCGDQSIASES